MAKDLIIRSSAEEFITFKVKEKDKGIQVRYENETLWMTQKAMAELFNVEQPAIAKHLINIYNEKELDKDSTYSKMELVQKEGNRQVKRNVEYYRELLDEFSPGILAFCYNKNLEYEDIIISTLLSFDNKYIKLDMENKKIYILSDKSINNLKFNI